MLGKDKPQGPGWVRAVPALCQSGEQSLFRVLLAGLSRTWRTLFLSSRTEPQGLLSRPRPFPVPSRREGSAVRGAGRRDWGRLGHSVTSLETSLVLPAADEEEQQG